MSAVPEKIQPDLKHAVRLEWWTLAWQASIVVVMYLVMGSSQAMKSAWTEDLLGLVPASVFLIAVHFERNPRTGSSPSDFSGSTASPFSPRPACSPSWGFI